MDLSDVFNVVMMVFLLTAVLIGCVLYQEIHQEIQGVKDHINISANFLDDCRLVDVITTEVTLENIAEKVGAHSCCNPEGRQAVVDSFLKYYEEHK